MNVFAGAYHLKFEKYPDYQTCDLYPSMKVKTLIDFGFTKLVLRIRAKGYTKIAIEMAERVFPYVTQNLSSNIFTYKPLEYEQKGFSRKYCYNQDGELMGAIEEFRHWYKYDLDCFPGCPKGVLFSRHHNKYFGFSHRGMAAFGIGDRLFDETWQPTWEDLRIEWVRDYCKSVGYSKIPKTIEEAKTFVRLRDIKTGESITSFIPFVYRGGKTIETKDEAIQAAINISLYLS